MKSLVYYSPAAIFEHEHSHPDIKRFSLLAGTIFSSTLSTVDRTGILALPVRTVSRFPIPIVRPMQRSFEDLCNDRARELLARANTLGVRTCVFWSGGIDSTLVLVSLLKNATADEKKNITVFLSEESIAENPRFYAEHVRGKLAVESAARLPFIFGGTNLVVNGEHNDQLFGSELAARFIAHFGARLNAKYGRSTMFDFFEAVIRDVQTTKFYLDLFDRVVSAAPIPIVTHFDYLWWLNFSLKWQSVYFRVLSFASERSAARITEDYLRDRYATFYGTDDFQLWSMSNLDKRIKDTWESYKWVCKDIIYDYTKDAEYRAKKRKNASLYYILVNQNRFTCIDNSLHFSRALPLEEYYIPTNDFV